MEKVTDYKIRIGDKLDYVEYGTDDRMPVIITNMIFDGFIFLIEFKHCDVSNKIPVTRNGGVTQYPDKLKLRL